jgi:hypothetical protein
MERGSRLVPPFVVACILGLLPFTTSVACGGKVPDGKQFGFVHEVSGGKLVFDPAEWLTGEEAAAAHRAHGEEQSEPFYIDNQKVEALHLPVGAAAKFTLLAYDSTGTPVLEKALSYNELAQLWATGKDDQLMSAGFGSDDLGLPMYLTISAGLVTGGKEQYIP